VPSPPLLPISLTEDARSLTLVLPRATDAPASDIEHAVQAFRQAIATVYVARLLRASADMFSNNPDAPAFTVSWRMVDDLGESCVVHTARTSQGDDLENHPAAERVMEEIMGVHRDPEVLDHLNDWLADKPIGPDTLDALGRHRVGPDWDRVRAAKAADVLDTALPQGARTRARHARV